MTKCMGMSVKWVFSWLLWIGAAIFLLGGCILLPPTDREQTVAGAYDHILPAGWEGLGDLKPINLDGDEQEENLLLFRFDNGQVGALIIEGDPATTISPPDFLLPRYYDEGGALGQGIIAAPGTPSSAITVTEVSGNSPAREVTIFGGGTHLTFAWWKGSGRGYGVTQLVAAGGFGVDWETWGEDPAPLSVVMGYEPLLDYRARSNICEMLLYTRRTDLPTDFPSIIYSAQPQGLHFCGSVIPAHPVAPEGVVLAYLRWPRAGDMGMLTLLTPGTTLPQLDAESASERWQMERVADIAAYASVPMSQEQVGGALTPTTAVCVEFAETVNPALRRWVVYTLRYQPADSAQRLPGRWTVSGARTEPPPMEPPSAGYCETILARNAP